MRPTQCKHSFFSVGETRLLATHQVCGHSDGCTYFPRQRHWVWLPSQSDQGIPKNRAYLHSSLIRVLHVYWKSSLLQTGLEGNGDEPE